MAVFCFWIYESGVVEASSIATELHSRLKCWFCCFYCVYLSSLVDSKRLRYGNFTQAHLFRLLVGAVFFGPVRLGDAFLGHR